MTQEFEGVRRIELDDLLPNPYQPESRLQVKPEKAREFALSFQKTSIIQAPVVRASRKQEGKYEVGDGWQRRAGAEYAVRELGLHEYETIVCIVKSLTDQQMADMILETIDLRVDMNPIERAQYYRKYFSEFPSITQAAFAEKHNRSQGEIANTLRLLELPENVQWMIISKQITETHGRGLLPLKDKEQMILFAEDVYAHEWTVAELEREIKAYLDKQKLKMEMAPGKGTEALKTEGTQALSETGEDTREEPAGGLEPVEEEEPGKPEASASGKEAADKPTEIPPAKPPALKSAGKPTTKPASSTAAATKPDTKPAAATEIIKPKWGIKLVIEEMDGFTRMSVMKAGGTPELWNYKGSFDEALASAAGWIAGLEEKWTREGKK